MSEYGIIINNSLGLPVVDSRYRSMEALAWGSLWVTNRGIHFITWPEEIQCPMVFIRSDPPAYMINGRMGLNGFGGASQMAVSADRDTTFHYVVAGFRFDNDTGGGFGLAAFDGNGKLGFSTSRRYLRIEKAPPAFIGNPISPNQGATWYQQSQVIKPTTYLCWKPKLCWHQGGNTNWYWGLAVTGSNDINVFRIDANADWYEQGLGSYFNSTSPGTTDIDPGLLMVAEFTP